MHNKNRPFKKVSLLIQEIESFLNEHAALFQSQGNRVNNFFEMNCYNYVVKYYETCGFIVSPQNLKDGIFRYKISPVGNPENFSHFLAEKNIKGVGYEFEVHHNLPIECANEREIFYTADISVITKGSVERGSPSTYSNKRSFCRAQNLQTFFEVKHLPPFPELLFSFIGIPENFLLKTPRKMTVHHLAPSLLSRMT